MKSKISKSLLFTLAVIIIAYCLPIVITNKYYTNLMIQVLINIVVVVGLNFITGLTGQMNLGTAGIFGLGSYTSALLVTKLGISPWMGLIGAIVMGMLIGLCLGYPSLRLKGVYLALTTIGFTEIVRILLTNLTDFTGGPKGISKIPQFSIFGFVFNNNKSVYYLYLTFTVILLALATRIIKSKWGRAFKAIKDNPDAMGTLGINISKMKIIAFTLATVYGCIGGSMYAHFFKYINPSTLTMDFSINYVIMMIIGGVGSVPGSILGSILVTITPELLRFLQSYYWLIFSIITLLFVVFLPNGIVSIFDGRSWSNKLNIGKKGGKKNGDDIKN